MIETTCPECGGNRNYTLKDGRLQCAECRKKYTAEIHRTKLTPHALRLIAGSFWCRIPASAAAAELGLNCKTVQKYYDLLRRALAQKSQTHAVQRFGASVIDPALFRGMTAGSGLRGDAQPLFCLAQAQGQEQVSLLFAAVDPMPEFTGGVPRELLGWVYAQDIEALHSLDLDRMRFLSADGAKGDAIGRPFWIYAKRNLVKYHGGFRRNFPLFVYEMEFRFNSHQGNAATAWLTEILLNT